MVSRIIYILALCNTALFTAFFFRLSELGEEALSVSPHIDFSFWFDYLGWLFFIVLGVYLHFNRFNFESEFAEAFNLSIDLHKKIAMVFFCDVLPLIMSITLFFRVSKWLIFNTGPGE